MSIEAVTAVLDALAGDVLRAWLGLATPELSAILAGGGFVVLLAGIYYMLRPSVLQDRLRSYVISAQNDGPAATVDVQPESPMILEVLERRLARRRAAASLRMRLVRAGLSITVVEFLALRIATGLVVALVVGIIFAFRIGLPALFVAAAAGVVASYVPSIVVSVLGKRRMARFESQLPAALDVLAASLQAGSGLAQGLAVLAREGAPPLETEFRQVLQEVNLGLSMREALTNLSNRVYSEDLDLVVTSIIIQMRVGGNLAQILRTAAGTVRERLALRGEIRVLTAQQRFSGIVIALLPLGVAGILWLLSPQYMGGLFDSSTPRAVPVGAVVMQLAGIFIMKKITDIDV